MTDVVRVTTEAVEEVDDPVLAELDELHRAQEALLAPMGEAEPQPALDPDRPYDLEVVKPRAIDLRDLYKRAGKDLPDDLEATLGPQVPVLLYQGVTPFTRPGETPRGVWGLGYEVRLSDVDAATVALSPDTEVTRLGSLDSKVRVGISAGGALAPPEAALAVVNAIPGISLHNAELEATTSTEVALALHVEFSVVKVEAGPIGTGGARWNIYRVDQRVVGFQPLIQTILVPDKTRKLKVTVQPWVARRGMLFGLIGSRKFIPPPTDFEVSLEGLGA
jgi:hypothetical protein